MHDHLGILAMYLNFFMKQFVVDQSMRVCWQPKLLLLSGDACASRWVPDDLSELKLGQSHRVRLNSHIGVLQETCIHPGQGFFSVNQLHTQGWCMLSSRAQLECDPQFMAGTASRLDLRACVCAQGDIRATFAVYEAVNVSACVQKMRTVNVLVTRKQ